MIAASGPAASVWLVRRGSGAGPVVGLLLREIPPGQEALCLRRQEGLERHPLDWVAREVHLQCGAALDGLLGFLPTPLDVG